MDDDQFFRITKAISDPTRFSMLERIASASEFPCSQLTDELPVSPPTISHHLKQLEVAGLIETRRNSKFMYLKLRRDIWKSYLQRLRIL